MPFYKIEINLKGNHTIVGIRWCDSQDVDMVDDKLRKIIEHVYGTALSTCHCSIVPKTNPVLASLLLRGVPIRDINSLINDL